MGIASAIAIGAVSGLRSMTGPAVISEAASRNILRLRRTPLAWLSSNGAARTFALLAVGEIVADKHPSIPSRTEAGPLIGRAISGALCGAAAVSHATGLLRRSDRKRVWLGALAGAGAAVGAAYLGSRYRKATKAHPIPSAMFEDLTAVCLGAATIQHLAEPA